MAERTIYEDFAVVAEELSFTAAAERLNVAQPWLSARIRQLERRVGFALFVRTTRRVKLTEEGRALFAKAQAISQAMQDFHGEVWALAGGPGRLRIGAPPYTGRIDIARRLLDALRDHRPAIAFDLDVGWTRQLLASLRAGEMDAIIILGPEKDDAFTRLKLMNTRLEIEMPVDHPLANVPLTQAALAGHEIEVFARNPNPDLFDTLFGQLRAEGALLNETNDMWSLKKKERPGSIVVAGSSALWGRPPREGRIRRLAQDGPIIPLALLCRNEPTGHMVKTLWHIARSLVAAG